MAIEEISVTELAALGPDVTIVDVREDDEWAEQRIPYARHVVLATVPGHLDQFDGDPTYVICRVGGRSQRACEFVAEHGRRVVNVAGGMMAWSAAGHVTVSDSTGDAPDG